MPRITMSDDHSSLVSTADLQTANDYIDKIVGQVRDAHEHGVQITVEELTAAILMAIAAGDVDPCYALAQQALMLAICMQRLS
jgi:hypothetical protein